MTELERMEIMNIRNAIITKASIKIEFDHILDIMLMLEYEGGGGQGFGGYVLHQRCPEKPCQIEGVAGHHLCRIMEICGVADWKDVVGKAIRVRLDKEWFGGAIQAIGHIINDDWYCPAEDFTKQAGE